MKTKKGDVFLKIKIKQEDLKTGIAICMPAVAKTSTNPWLEGFLLSVSSTEAKMTGYDCNNAIVYNLPCEIIEPGETVISAKLFSNIVGKSIGDITIETNNSTCYISSGMSVYELAIYDADNYPEIPTPPKSDGVVIQTNLIKKAYKKISAFTGAESLGNPILKTIRIDIIDGKIDFVACDGYKIADAFYKYEFDSSTVFSINIEKSILRCISDIESDVVTIYPGKRHNLIKTNNTTFIVRAWDGEFINYKELFSKDENYSKGKVDVKEISKAIDMAIPVVDNAKKTPIRLNFNKDITISSCSSLGNMKTTCPMIESVKPLEIGFNSQFLIDGFAACSQKEVDLKTLNATSPIMILDEETRILILPMRLKK